MENLLGSGIRLVDGLADSIIQKWKLKNSFKCTWAYLKRPPPRNYPRFTFWKAKHNKNNPYEYDKQVYENQSSFLSKQARSASYEQ